MLRGAPLHEGLQPGVGRIAQFAPQALQTTHGPLGAGPDGELA